MEEEAATIDTILKELREFKDENNKKINGIIKVINDKVIDSKNDMVEVIDTIKDDLDYKTKEIKYLQNMSDIEQKYMVGILEKMRSDLSDLDIHIKLGDFRKD